MAWFSTDSLRTAIAAVNPFAARGQVQGIAPGVMNHQMALAAFRSSGMLRKVITVPAEDRVREWRDWQAEKPQIELIEAEEKRLGLVAKVRQAEVLRGIGGGALILAAPGLPTEALRPETIRKSGLQAVNVVSRWQITGRDYVKELTDPAFGTPRLFEIAGENGAKTIHPSRVICFRGDPLPAGAGLGEEDAFWGDSRLVRVLREVENSDATQRWFAELVKKAKLLRIGIPDLADMLAKPGGQAKLEARVATIANGESILNATVFSSAAKDGAGETITDYQVTWAGIPAMMDAFDQRVAAVADIPFTRLMGRSPAGMNATGAYDDQNWSKTVGAGQQLETRPCLEQLDPVLLRSAGIPDPAKVTWKWAPLWSPTEKELAETFKTEMEAVKLLQESGTIPEQAMNRGVQNLMSEREYVPGLDQALALIPEALRFGIRSDDDGSDPSAITQSGNGSEGGDQSLSPTTRGAGGSNGAPARAVNDGVTADD